MDDRFTNARFEKALAWLGHRMPGRQGMWHQPPCCARAHEPTQAIEDCAQAMRTLWGVFCHEGQVGGHQGPFVIIHIRGVCFAFHTASVASSKHKYITPSSEDYYIV